MAWASASWYVISDMLKGRFSKPDRSYLIVILTCMSPIIQEVSNWQLQYVCVNEIIQNFKKNKIFRIIFKCAPLSLFQQCCSQKSGQGRSLFCLNIRTKTRSKTRFHFKEINTRKIMPIIAMVIWNISIFCYL